MARDFAKAFYKSKEWERVREYVIRRDKYLCVKCGEPAEEIHHVEHLSPENVNDPAVALSPDNLISLCRDCHFAIHKESIVENTILSNKQRRKSDTIQGYEFDEYGQVVPVAKEVYLVYGSPGSGKTTHVRQHMQVGDLVVDLDLIRQALSMQGRTEETVNLLPVVLRVRDTIYSMIANREVDCERVWVIAGLPNKAQREQVLRQLRATPVLIDTPMDECIRRVYMDKDRVDKTKQERIIRKWFAEYQA